MDIEVILQIVVAVFAVFGFCSLIKLILEAIALPDNIALAVICEEESEAGELGVAINRARAAWHTPASRKCVVLLREGVELPPEIREALGECGVDICRVSAGADAPKE